MRKRARADLGLADAATRLLLAPPQPGQADGPYDPDDTMSATGAVFETEEEFAGKSRTTRFRAFLSPEADLRDRFPRPGEQGSCVGWAVGDAAPSCYVNPLEGRRPDAATIPSPACIYDAIGAPGAGCDADAEISDALDLLKAGAVVAADHPYDGLSPRRAAAAVGYIVRHFAVVGSRISSGAWVSAPSSPGTARKRRSTGGSRSAM